MFTIPTLETFEWNRDKLRKQFKKMGMYSYYNNCCGGMLHVIVVASFYKTKIFWSRFALRKWNHLLNYVKKFVSLVGNIVLHDKIRIYASWAHNQFWMLELHAYLGMYVETLVNPIQENSLTL
jgi:hypothetical protein